jgi:hypothetical protein
MIINNFRRSAWQFRRKIRSKLDEIIANKWFNNPQGSFVAR